MNSQNGCVVVLLIGSTLVFATVPVLLNIVSRVLRAHYRRVMWKSRSGDAQVEAAAETDEAAPGIPLVEAKHVPISPHSARGEAATATREMQIAHGIAAVVYATSVVATMLGFVTMQPFASRLAMAYASLAPQLLLVMWTLRLERRKKMWVFLIHGAAGAVLVARVGEDVIDNLWAAAAVALLIIPALLVLIDRVIEPFVILLTPIVFVIFGIGIVLDRMQPEMIEQGEEVLKGLHWWILISGLGSAIAGFYLVRALLRKGWAVRVIAGALALIAVLVLNPTNDRPVSHAVGVAGVIGAVVLQALIVGALFQFLVWLQDRHILTNELLHIHVAWLLLTIYFELWAWNAREFIGLRWWFVCAFAVSTVTLHVLLLLLRRRRRPIAKKRLLLLRAFGGPEERQDLLDDLRDTWRRIGAIDMIAAADVATGTLKPDMLAAFVLRRTGEQYLESEKAAAKWVEEHRAAIEGDARYPQNAAFCPDHVRKRDAWKHVFIPLARGANVILMDVRNFTRAHEGCEWEIKTLRDENLLHRVVFIANSATHGQAIAELLPGHDLEMLDYEHRTNDERRALFDRLLDVAYA
ncbi:MAG TPA: hypothetical protein VFV49_08310 [Thermoanaerobaculia bacterium]|nr:hypothetical protein [Thermoanaerobaculia bacterium]